MYGIFTYLHLVNLVCSFHVQPFSGSFLPTCTNLSPSKKKRPPKTLAPGWKKAGKLPMDGLGKWWGFSPMGGCYLPSLGIRKHPIPEKIIDSNHGEIRGFICWVVVSNYLLFSTPKIGENNPIWYQVYHILVDPWYLVDLPKKNIGVPWGSPMEESADEYIHFSETKLLHNYIDSGHGISTVNM